MKKYMNINLYKEHLFIKNITFNHQSNFHLHALHFFTTGEFFKVGQPSYSTVYTSEKRAL